MDPAPRISIVIPHLNQPEALARCMQSLAAQRGGITFEVIVVDNGSAEPPVAVCAAMPDVMLLHESVPGPGPARNRGAAVARGEVIAFIDADCTAAPGWLAAIAEHFAAHDPAPIVGGDVRIAPRDPDRLTTIEAYESVFGYRMQLYITRDNYTASCNMAVRREVFTEVGPFPGIATAEDRAWGQRAVTRGHRLAYLPAMQVMTPARADFAELARKWDRHIAHDRAALQPGRRARIFWCLRAVALAVSPVIDIAKIARSDRLRGTRARAAALVGLARIRLYRARRMLQTAAGSNSDDPAGRWNRP